MDPDGNDGRSPETPDSRAARLLRHVRRGAALIAGVSMLLMMLAGALDVIGTNVFAKPIPAAFEFMASLMVVVVFFSVALAQAQRAHVRVAIATERMPPRLRSVAEGFQFLCNFAFFVLIAWFGWKSGLRSFEVGEYASGAVNWPTFPARSALAIGASVMALQCLYDLIAHVLGRRDATETARAIDRPQ